MTLRLAIERLKFNWANVRSILEALYIGLNKQGNLTRDAITHTGTQYSVHDIHRSSLIMDVLASQGLRDRIEDLRKQIDLMSDQLGKKNDQISQLNGVTQKQTVHIQSLGVVAK